MGFLKKQSPAEQAPVPFDMECATKLYNGLRKVGMLARTYRAPVMKSWANEFRLMRTYLEEAEITSVMGWYLSHCKEKFIPAVSSAQKFRKEFDRIVKAMKRSTDAPSSVVITPLAKKISANLHLLWPGGEKLKELEFIQLTLNYFYRFRARLQGFMEAEKLRTKGMTSSKEKRMLRVADSIFWRLAAPSSLTEWWASEINHLSHSWPGYSGMLLERVPADDSDRWDKHLAHIVSEYCGDGSPWFELKEKLKEFHNGKEK